MVEMNVGSFLEDFVFYAVLEMYIYMRCCAAAAIDMTHDEDDTDMGARMSGRMIVPPRLCHLEESRRLAETRARVLFFGWRRRRARWLQVRRHTIASTRAGAAVRAAPTDARYFAHRMNSLRHT